MQSTVFIAALTIVCIVSWPVGGQPAEDNRDATKASGFSLTWWHIGEGGATASAGQYELAFTIGDSDAGTLVGGDFVLEGGFLAGTPVKEGMVFSDGFECSSTSGWSSAAGL